MRKIPLLTFSLLLITIGLYALAPDPSSLYFSAEEIVRGEVWRGVSGHFMHADLAHLAWNGLGLGVLGALIETRSRTLLWVSLAIGIAAVSLFLMMPFAPLRYYCGLSGVLNTLLVIALWLEWRATRSWLVVAVAIGSLGKVFIELVRGDSMLTHISWPPFAWSHLAGLVGGLLIVGIARGLCSGPSRSVAVTLN